MPLIRLISHAPDNKWLCDKMIFIEGIPEHLLFNFKGETRYLKTPWEVDVTENIPKAIRDRFCPNGMDIHKYIPSPDKGIPPIDDALTVYGLYLDCQNGQAEELWKAIEGMIEDITPRGSRLPKPAIVAPGLDDAHRNLPFSIGPDDIPVVDLRKKTEVPAETPRKAEVIPETKTYACDQCERIFEKPKALSMHKMKAHRKVPVGV